MGPEYWCYVVLDWILARCPRAPQDGTMQAFDGASKSIIDTIFSLRAAYATIEDDRTARMTLTYVHFVHILVDSLVVLTPFAVYPKLGALSILLSGLVTFFYKGLLQISHGFFDPFGNEDTTQDNIQLDVLIAQTNLGSLRWARSMAVPVGGRTSAH